LSEAVHADQAHQLGVEVELLLHLAQDGRRGIFSRLDEASGQAEHLSGQSRLRTSTTLSGRSTMPATTGSGLS
jgi:hypothetical protein